MPVRTSTQKKKTYDYFKINSNVVFLLTSSRITYLNNVLLYFCTPFLKDLATTDSARRISVQMTSAALKNNFVVSQSDLWDTHTLSHAKQRQSPRNHPNPQRCHQEHGHGHMMSTGGGYDSQQMQQPIAAPIQRSVSEKNRTKHRHKPKVIMGQSETDSEREREPATIGGPNCHQSTSPGRKFVKTMQHAHHHSSPNVAPSERRKYRNKTEPSMFNASSESELLDGDKAILPIFRKLLTEKQPRYRGRNNVVGASCPNISIKCDIVEYL